MSNKVINNDIMRYKKNKLSANLALLGLLFGAIYFMFIYGIYAEGAESDSVKEFFYKPQLGFSVLVNLIFLLMVFYCSEEIKAYNRKFAYVEFVIAAVQIGRIFYYPVYGHSQNAMSAGMMAVCIVFLVLSAACLIASGVFGILRAIAHDKHIAQVENGELNMDAVLEELDAADSKNSDNEAATEASVTAEVK